MKKTSSFISIDTCDRLYGGDRYNNAVEIIGGAIFFTAFIVSPIFLIYQTVLRLIQKSHYKIFKIVKITYFFLLLNVVFYSFIYYILSNATK